MKIDITVDGLEDLARLDVAGVLAPIEAEIARELDAEPASDQAGPDARSEQLHRVVDRLVAQGLLQQS